MLLFYSRRARLREAAQPCRDHPEPLRKRKTQTRIVEHFSFPEEKGKLNYRVTLSKQHHSVTES